MSWLLDTNVLSELRTKQPDPRVVQWVSARPAKLFYLSVLTLGEIRKGVDGVADAAIRARLEHWLNTELAAHFRGRILPVDDRVAQCWGSLLARAGRPIPAIDSLIAATALAHRLIVVTRNLSDFEGLDVPVINPWTHSGESAHEQLHEPRAVYATGKTPIRVWREQRGLSRAQLASEAGISVSVAFPLRWTV